jgi:alkyl hydroperoxide reductase subunit F
MLYDLAIIGGGPAGVAAGVYASRKQLHTIFITKDFGGQSIVSDGIENWIGTVKISGTDLAKNLETHLRAYASGTDDKAPIVEIKTGELCQSIQKSNTPKDSDSSSVSSTIFLIRTNKGNYSARTVLIATGSDRRKLDVLGADTFEHKGLTYCASCDGPLFAGQDVAIVGGGNAGFESAAQLLAYCKSVTLLNRSDKLRADPTTIAAVTANPKMKLINNAIPKEVKGEKFVTTLIYIETIKNTSRDVELPVTGIFVEIGSVPTTYFAKDLVTIDAYNRIVVDPRNQRTSVDGVWAAGDATDGIYHQNNIAAGDAVKALEDIYIYVSKLTGKNKKNDIQ